MLLLQNLIVLPNAQIYFLGNYSRNLAKLSCPPSISKSSAVRGTFIEASNAVLFLNDIGLVKNK